MTQVAIKVENLGKKYLIKHEQKESYKTFQDALINTGKKIITSLNPFYKSEYSKKSTTIEEFWALNDVNFEINQGDRVGIIGRNGAGKSTLLKVLSRITEPTTGKIHINGRIASLLEVGTGFHPELTGRENIFLNGAILGMSRKEIDVKFDEIVAFSEVEKFLDTPVKRYSSGMYVRLAFSVAAYLEPDILIIDEVLAVGDAPFQKKCLGKMDDVSRQGRTILFVSHNMNAIEQLCQQVIIMNNGAMVQYSSTKQAINTYLKLNYDESKEVIIDKIPRVGNLGTQIRFTDADLINAQDEKVNSYKTKEKIILSVVLNVYENSYDDMHVNVSIYDIKQLLITTVTSRTEYGYIKCSIGRGIYIKISLDSLMLSAGEYNVTLAVGRRGHVPFDILKHILPFSIQDTYFEQKVACPELPGIIKTNSSWNVR